MKLRVRWQDIQGGQLITAAVLLLTALLVAYIARNTYWKQLDLPVRLRGPAAVNPFYGANQLATRLGAHTQWQQNILQLSPPPGVMFASSWSFEVPGRNVLVESWVEEGGRLVLDEHSLIQGDELERWAGIGRVPLPEAELPPLEHTAGTTAAIASGAHDPWGAPRHYQLCCLSRLMALKTRAAPSWTLRDAQGHLLGARINIGKGSVTVISGEPFSTTALTSGDAQAESHAQLLVETLQLRQGDTLYFFSDSGGPTLLPLMWRTGWPAVLLALALVLLALWRATPRFGPLEAPLPRTRRSLGEQIRGSGQFILRYGGGQALLSAAARALALAARGRIRGYTELAPEAQAAMLEQLTGIARSELVPGLSAQRPRSRRELYRTLQALESARRALLRPAQQLKVRSHAD